MKRTLVLLTVILVVLTFSSVSLADRFTIHSGTAMGMSMNEVISLEKEAGFKMEKDTLVKKTKAAKQIIGSGKIAGIEKSKVVYMFDNNDKLFSAVYDLGSILLFKQSDYDSVEKTLTEKYGTPDTSWYVIAKNIGYEPVNYFNNKLESGSAPSSASSWMVDNGDGTCVIVSHFKMSGPFFDRTFTIHIVGYQQYSVDDINKEMSNITQEYNDNQDQLNNDL